MADPVSFWYVNALNVIGFRMDDFTTGVPVSSGIAVSADLKRGSTVLQSGIALSYDANAKMYKGDPETGGWVANVAASVVNAVGQYTVVITVTTSPGGVLQHTATQTYKAVIDDGRLH